MNTEAITQKVDKFKELLIQIATSNINHGEVDNDYRELRKILTTEPTLAQVLPRWVTDNRNPGEFWGFIKPQFPTYAERRNFIRQEFLQVYNVLENSNSCQVKDARKPLLPEEVAFREKVAAFLDIASEDQFTETMLVPLFQALGFERVSQSGHRDKTLEFGKDLWMKFRLPTGHWIYFCAQIKRDKIDSSASGANNNVANILTQIEMALAHPVFDPDVNRRVLVDHMFIISGGFITKAARTWLAEKLDMSKRRQLIFMDRDELLDLCSRMNERISIPLT